MLLVLPGGAHLQSIQTNGLKLKSDLKEEHTLRRKATTAEEFKGKADVIFVCVKGYSVDSITELIKRAAHEKTIVIPYSECLRNRTTYPTPLVPGVTVLDGCIYIVGFVSGTERSLRWEKFFRLVYGAHKGTQGVPESWKPFRKTFRKAESKLKSLRTSIGIPSSNGRSSRQWRSLVLTMTYPWVKYRSRERYVIRSSAFLRRVPHWDVNWGVEFPEDPVSYNLKVIDKLDPESTASMQKDLARGHESEIQGLLFRHDYRCRRTRD